MYRIQTFAKLAGVTVRTLHHYDQRGLLKPGRSAAGYRIYSDQDLVRLQQIVALKFAGVPLSRIRVLFDRTPLEVATALNAQHAALLQQRSRIEKTIEAVEQAQNILRTNPQRLPHALRTIIEMMERNPDMDWLEKYYSAEGQQQLAARRLTWTPELQAEVSARWEALFADIAASLDQDPASASAQALGERWLTLVDAFTQNSPALTAGVAGVWNHQQNWPAETPAQMQAFRKPEVWAYMQRVLAARGTRQSA